MYENQTVEAVKARILSAIQEGQGLSSMAGGFADGVSGPVAEEISRVYQALNAVPSMLFVDDSSGGYIDLVGKQYFNLTRRSGTKAYCKMTFTGTAGLTIPRGTQFLTAGGLAFSLMAQVDLDGGGTGSGRLEAAQAGSVYNVEVGTISRMYINLPGLTGYRNEAAEGGTDEESDAALLARIRERVQRPPTSGNGYQYRQWALEVPGVGNAKVVELPDGPGTVSVTLVDSNYEPPAEEIVTAVKNHIGEERPIGASVTVAAAKRLNVTVAAAVTLVPGADRAAVEKAFRVGLEEHCHSLIDGKFSAVYYEPDKDLPYTVLYNRVLAILLNLPGVENFSTLTINGGTKDLTVQKDEIPVLGEAVVS